MAPIHLKVAEGTHRAVSGGTGSTKCAGNYASGLAHTVAAQGAGFNDVVYLDAATGVRPALLMSPCINHPSSPHYLQYKISTPVPLVSLSGVMRCSMAIDTITQLPLQEHLEEVSACNVFSVKGRRIHTPPLSGTILPGVTRDRCGNSSAACPLAAPRAPLHP